MANQNRLLDQLRHVALHALGEQRTDGQLLEHFIAQRDEIAFAILLKRHGPMVRSVCQRVVGNAHDADDAFQATFLVLVRKAASIRPREAVGNFLYGVAYRTALELRTRLARRRAKETSLEHVAEPASKPAELWQELRPLLDRELSRLSEKFRLPVVLCDLENRSRKEVARQLAIPEGTLSSRLATARKKLAARLTRYGYVLSGVTVASLLSENAASACLPASLLSATCKAALLVAAGPMAAAGMVSATVATLTEGVLKTMFLAKIKTATVVLFGATVLSLGTGGVIYQTRAGAAGSPQLNQSGQEQPKPGARAETQEKDKWRRIAEEAQAREEKLRLELQQAHQEIANWRTRREVEDRRAVAEELRRAELLQLAKNKAVAAAREAEAARNRANGQQPRPDLEGVWPPLKADPKEALAQLQRQEDIISTMYQGRCAALKEQQQRMNAELQELEERRRKSVADLEAKKVEVLKQLRATQPSQKANQAPGSDKLDQILQHLERMEKRLDRLERGGK